MNYLNIFLGSIALIVFVILIFLLYEYRHLEEKTITYRHTSHMIHLKSIKDLPDWLKKYEIIRINRVEKTIHKKERNIQEEEIIMKLERPSGPRNSKIRIGENEF